MSLLESAQNPDNSSKEKSEVSPLLDKRTETSPSTSAAASGNQHEELPIRAFELFSDLVVAGVVSSLQSPLTGDEIPGIADWLWFWLRVFFIWTFWNYYLLLNDSVDLYGNNDTAEIFIFLNVLGTVFALAAIAMASLNGNNVLCIVIYLLGRLSVTLLADWETNKGEGPRHVDPVADGRYERFKRAYRVYGYVAPLECLPLLISLVFFRDRQYGVLVGGYMTFAIFLGCRGYLARKADSILSSVDDNVGSIFNLCHIRERYEVITLAVLGGLCFMDPSGGQAGYVSFRALVVAIGAFLLYYHALGRTTGSFEASAEGHYEFPNVQLQRYSDIVVAIVFTMVAIFFTWVDRQQQSQADRIHHV